MFCLLRNAKKTQPLKPEQYVSVTVENQINIYPVRRSNLRGSPFSGKIKAMDSDYMAREQRAVRITP